MRFYVASDLSSILTACKSARRYLATLTPPPTVMVTALGGNAAKQVLFRAVVTDGKDGRRRQS